MRIIGCDLHARQQTVAMLDTVSGEVVNRTLMPFSVNAKAAQAQSVALHSHRKSVTVWISATYGFRTWDVRLVRVGCN